MDLEESGAAFDWGERLHHYYHEGKRLLRKFWWIVLLGAAVGGAWRAYVGLREDPVYTSSAQMHVSGRMSLPSDTNVYREELSNFFGTQMDLMTSQKVRRKAHERVKMMKPDVERAWVNVTARQKPNTSIFLLRARGGSGPYTRAFLDAVMEEYQNLRDEMRSETSESTLLAVSEQLNQLEKQIEEQEDAVVEFQRKNNLVFLKEQGDSAGSYLAQLKNKQAELRTRLIFLETLQPGETIEAITPSGEGEGGSAFSVQPETLKEYRAARRELSSLEAEREEFGRYLRDRHPKMINLDLDIERMRERLEILEEQTRSKLGDEAGLLKRKIRNLDSVIEQWKETALEISRKNAEFERLESRLERSRQTYQRLLDSVQSIKLTQGRSQQTVGVLQEASAPSVSRVDLRRQVIEGAGIGALGGMGLIVAIGFLDTRVKNAEDLKRRFNKPVLGLLPFEKTKGDDHLKPLTVDDERHRFAEACRTLRSTLMFLNGTKEQQPRSFLVTSAIPEDGKSTVSTNLAITFSMMGAKVLVVDADIRRGNLARDFPELVDPDKPGLQNFLEEGLAFDEVLQETGYAGLQLVASGVARRSASELMLSSRVEEFVAAAERAYDYVIVDSPPILAVDDTVGLVDKFDAILFTVRVNHTSAKQVKTSVERLEGRGIGVSGFVLNCADVRGSDYYYYKNYDYYYSRKAE